MKLWEKIFLAVLGTLIFFITGGIACTYTVTNGVNLILVGALGVLIFIAAGASACLCSNNKISKQKSSQTTS